MNYNYNPYTLPTIDFVGGETQNLAFHVYFHNGKLPFSLYGCSGEFSIVSFGNKTGAPILIKDMSISISASEDAVDNILTVKLLPSETVSLFGKYIYQISIRDAKGNVEIPKQGVMYISNNIDKGFIR